MKITSNLMECFTTVHQTLSICSRCLECCSMEERELYGQLSEDAALMLKKINKAIQN